MIRNIVPQYTIDYFYEEKYSTISNPSIHVQSCLD